MKRNSFKSFFAGMLAMLLIMAMVGSVLAYSGKVQKELEYRNISVSLNGTKLNLKDASGVPVEPFLLSGTNYLPVRALAESLGLSVQWDGTANTIILKGGASGDGLSSVQTLGFYKILQENLEYLNDVFENLAFNISFYTTESQAAELRTSAINKISTALSLAEEHYNTCNQDKLLNTEDIELMSNYRRLANKAIDNLKTLSGASGNSYTSVISGAAQQNAIDALLAALNAQTEFWNTYQEAFN